MKPKEEKARMTKKDAAAYILYLQKDRLKKAVKKVSFHLVDKLKTGHKASSLLGGIKMS